MRKYQIFIILSLLLLLVGCARNEVFTRNYYILEYYGHSEKEELFQDEPLDNSVLVMDSRVSRTYDRRQIVRRQYGPKIQYAEYDLWGVKLSDIIPDLIAKRLKNYNSFKQVQREYFKEIPDYQIMTMINNIEILESENLMQARLNIEFVLRRGDGEGVLLRHYVNREENIADLTIDTFVQTINDIVLEETDVFIKKINAFMAGEEIVVEDEDSKESIDFSLIDLYREDIAGGSGLLFMPALTNSENEPYYQIIDGQGNSTIGRFGEAKALMEGKYSVVYGSGDASQKMRKEKIEIIPRYKQIVEPDWGCLIVDVIDKSRNYAKVAYEIFDIGTGESFGSDFPAEEEVGELDKVWVLKPGIYKVTINSEPFNTYSNFTTVQVDNNKAKQLTIVVDTDEDGNPLDMVGAGVLTDIYDVKNLSNLKFFNAIHANVNFNSDNSLDSEKQVYNIIANAQFDNSIVYDNYPYHFSFKAIIEAGMTKSTDTEFRKSSDDINIKNTFLYYFFEDIGFYGRFDARTHLMKDIFYSEDPVNYAKFDVDGKLTEYKENQFEFELKPPILPFKIKEGLGVNYRILKKSKSNLSVRAGLGLRQTFNSNVYSWVKDGYNDTIGEIEIKNAKKYVEEEYSFTQGTEFSVVASFQLPIGLTYTTNADILIPFTSDEAISAEWENSFDLRLFKYLSLNYKLKLQNSIPEQGAEYLLSEHSLFLRVTYFLR